MKLIESKAEILKQENGLQGIYKQIELAGRTCYKSEDKITDASSVDFVKRMTESGHTAMLEHGTIYLAIPITTNHAGFSENRYRNNPYSKFKESQGLCMRDEYGDECDCWCITTNLRVLEENGWLDDLEYLCEPTEFHERRITLKFTTDRGVSHELVRHRVFSFAQESTRYCNYTKDKFGNELTFIKPSWLNEENENAQWPFLQVLDNAERQYRLLTNPKDIYKWTPQQARQILPNALKTEIVMTGFASDWKHFFDLRLLGTTGKPHPDMLLLAEKAKEVLDENNLWLLIYNQNDKT